MFTLPPRKWPAPSPLAGEGWGGGYQAFGTKRST
jgi:hypothetical protein